MRGVDHLLRRLGFAAVTVLVAVTFNFVLFRALPGDAVSNLSHVPRASPELREALRREFGLDRSLPDQYVIYLGRLVRGNLGVSYDNLRPVSENLREALTTTLPMVAAGLGIAVIAGVAMGTLSGWRRGGWFDRAGTNLTILFFSFPAHWIGLILLIVFAGTLPSGGARDQFLVDPGTWAATWDRIRHMVLPSTTLALSLFGGYMLVARSAVSETLGEDYVLMARAKGLRPGFILRRYALRNAMLPMTTMIALSLGRVVTGYILIETVFSWPGVGRAVYQAVLERDYPMLQGAFLLLTLSVVVCNLVADLVSLCLDPRIAQP